MKFPSITIEQKKYILIPNEEYITLKEDIEDLKKVLQRKNETGKEAKGFFSDLKKSKLKKEIA